MGHFNAIRATALYGAQGGQQYQLRCLGEQHHYRQQIYWFIVCGWFLWIDTNRRCRLQSNEPGHLAAPSFTISSASGAQARGADKPTPATGDSSTAAIVVSGGPMSLTNGPFAHLVVNGQIYRYIFAANPETPVTIAAGLV